MLNPDVERLLADIETASPRPLRERQLVALDAVLRPLDFRVASRIVETFAIADFPKVAQLVVSLREAYQPDTVLDMPKHSPRCPHGCEGEAWTPGPAQQFARWPEEVRLRVCPGQPLTAEAWRHEQKFLEQWQPQENPDRVVAAAAGITKGTP